MHFLASSIHLFKVLMQSSHNVSFRETEQTATPGGRTSPRAAGWESAGLLPEAPCKWSQPGPASQPPPCVCLIWNTSRQPRILSTPSLGSRVLWFFLPQGENCQWTKGVTDDSLRHWRSTFRKLDFLWNWLEKKIQPHEDNPTIWKYLEWIKIVLIWGRGCNSRQHEDLFLLQRVFQEQTNLKWAFPLSETVCSVISWIPSLKGWDSGLPRSLLKRKQRRPVGLFWNFQNLSENNMYSEKHLKRQNNPESDTYLWPSSWAMVKAKLRPLSSASTHFLLALHTPPK